MKTIVTSFIALSLTMGLVAQQTGRFSESIPFEGGTRALAYSVPDDYVPEKTYPLVVALHGCGGSETRARGELAFLSDAYDIIVVAPEGPVTNGGFMGNTGNNEDRIINAALDHAFTQYAIDSGRVFLWGFSCNGLATAAIGTYEYLYPFKGIIPFNPAVNNQNFTFENFNFETTTPVCLCSGTADSFYDQSMRLRDSLIVHDATMLWNSMPGIPHTYTFSGFQDEMHECFGFFGIETVGISELSHEQMALYPNPASHTLYLRNTGEITLSGDVVIRDLSGKPIEEIGNVRLGSGQQKRIDVSEWSPGFYFVHFAGRVMRVQHH